MMWRSRFRLRINNNRIIMETVTMNPTQTASERIVNAVCVDALDLGTVNSVGKTASSGVGIRER